MFFNFTFLSSYGYERVFPSLTGAWLCSHQRRAAQPLCACSHSRCFHHASFSVDKTFLVRWHLLPGKEGHRQSRGSRVLQARLQSWAQCSGRLNSLTGESEDKATVLATLCCCGRTPRTRQVTEGSAGGTRVHHGDEAWQQAGWLAKEGS